MKLYFLKDVNQYLAGDTAVVELTLGRRFVDEGKAIPLVTHLEKVEREKREAAEKKAEELKTKKETAAPKKRATSKRASTRKKAVK